MTALTGRAIKDTYKDLLQISNSNSGIDGTLRTVQDGEGANSTLQLSTTGVKMTGTVTLTGATLALDNDQIPLAAVDLSDNDTLSGALAVSGSVTLTTAGTLNVATGTLTLAANQIPLTAVDLSDNDTIEGAWEFSSGSSLIFTTGATLDVTAATLSLRNDQIPLAKVDLSDNDTISGALAVASGASVSFASGASLSVSQGATYDGQVAAHFQERQSAGTDGGALTASAWRTRALNTTIRNNVSAASLGSSQVTLPKGRYRVTGFAAANRVNGHMSRLYNTTASAPLLHGSSGFANVAVEANSLSLFSGEITLTTASTLELQHRVEVTRATDGRGTASNVSASEIYSDVLFIKVSA